MGLAGGASNARGENPSEIEVPYQSLALSLQQWILALVGEAVPCGGTWPKKPK